MDVCLSRQKVPGNGGKSGDGNPSTGTMPNGLRFPEAEATKPQLAALGSYSVSTGFSPIRILFIKTLFWRKCCRVLRHL